MARVLGSRVYSGPGKEIGWSPLALTASGQSSPLRHLAELSVLHWHGDTFDLPEGAALLASTPAFAHQAFSSGPNILGLQFHGEVDAREIERWLVGHACEIAAAGLDIEELRRGAQENGEPLKRAGTALIDDWLSGLDL
jgi:GMP synthase (glutamine-hydrolysing)